MPVRFPCPECQQLLVASTRKIGKKVSCLNCRAPITVPSKEQASAMIAVIRSSPDGADAALLKELVVYDEDLEGESRGQRVDRLVEVGSSKGSLLLVSREMIYAHAALVAVVAGLAFAAGYLIGGAGDAPPQPAAVTASDEPVTADLLVTYTNSAGQKVPDTGAVVLILPEDSAPQEKLPVAGFYPENLQNAPDENTLQALDTIGGLYARVEDTNALRVLVPRPGIQRVLLVSRNTKRAPTFQDNPDDLATLGRYFESLDFIGDNKYQFSLKELREGTLIEHDFGKSGE